MVDLVCGDGDLRPNRIFVSKHERFVLVVLEQNHMVSDGEAFTFDGLNNRCE